MLGPSYYPLGDFKSAIMFHQELAVSIAKAVGNNYTEKLAYQSLGLAHHSLDNVEKAQEFHHQALIKVLARTYLYTCWLCILFKFFSNERFNRFILQF